MHYLFEKRPDGAIAELVFWSDQIGPDRWQLFRPNRSTGNNALHSLGRVLEGIPVNDKLGVVWNNWNRIAQIENGS